MRKQQLAEEARESAMGVTGREERTMILAQQLPESGI